METNGIFSIPQRDSATFAKHKTPIGNIRFCGTRKQGVGNLIKPDEHHVILSHWRKKDGKRSRTPLRFSVISEAWSGHLQNMKTH